MKVRCPSCQSLLSAEEVDVQGDVATCAKCGEVFSFSKNVVAGNEAIAIGPVAAPPGAWYAETDTGWQMGATTRSSGAFFLVPFMCVWSGGSLGGIYGMQIAKG